MNAQDTRLLAAAAEVRAALTDGAGIKARDGLGRTALLLAALGDHVETARVLVAAGADPDAQDQQWGSPCACAVPGPTPCDGLGWPPVVRLDSRRSPRKRTGE